MIFSLIIPYNVIDTSVKTVLDKLQVQFNEGMERKKCSSSLQYFFFTKYTMNIVVIESKIENEHTSKLSEIYIC